MSRAAIYADINPNAIDGSSIWMMSITEVLSSIFDEVWVILKTEPVDQSLVQSVQAIPNVILDFDGSKPSDYERTVAEAADRVEQIHADLKLDVVVVRGLEACFEFCRRSSIAPVLWSYVTDLPYPTAKLSRTNRGRLENIASNSVGLFSQTEASRAYYESLAPSAAGKTYLLPPMLPDYAFASERNTEDRGDLTEISLVYAGKLAEDWKTLELVELPGELKKLGINATLYIVGDKINRGVADPLFAPKMKSVLNSAKSGEYDGVVALGKLPREESIRIIQSADFGIGWRTSNLDSSLEVSTKALEYSAAGTPPILNRNSDHEKLFGQNYPYFVSAGATVRDLAEVIADRMDAIPLARELSGLAAEPYSMASARERLRTIFEREQVRSLASVSGSPEATVPTKIVVASHDLKFAGELLNLLQKDARFDVRFDHWDTLHLHDENQSGKLAEWADTVFCEFAGPNLAFYSQQVGPETKLVARLHGFEVRNRAPWFSKVNFENVDEIITVSSHYAEQTMDFLPQLSGKVSVVPNMVDCLDFGRPKNQDAQFHLGLVGMVPFLKRPDRALDLLQELVRIDNRYVLHIKGRMPWDYPYIWREKIQRYQYLDFFKRIYQDPILKNHVVFDPFSTDIASWLRGIGIVLSPSDNESFHLAPAEGMASGAIPIVWERDGAPSVFGEHNVFGSINDMRNEILDLSETESFEVASRNVKAEAVKWDVDAIYKQWFSKLDHTAKVR